TQIFDPASGRVESGPDLPVAIPAAIALGSGRRLYVLGFPRGRDIPLKLYSIGEGETEWRPEPDGPEGGGSSYGTACDGKLYTVVPHRYLAVYDTRTCTWETIPAPHSPRSPAVGHHRGEIWVMGGRTDEGGQVAYIYSPTSRQWRKGPPLPREIVWGAAFNIDGSLFITGGAAGRCYNNRTFRLRAGYAGASHP
ncbi:MAG: Kelch repeat-containing protein, partial [Planctomycetota bacterium]